MSRKSQVDKFESRLAKKRQDEEVIQTTEFKNSTLEKRAGKVASHYGISTEDIFAIIARDSIGSFIKMWNNSMETVIRETVRTEVKEVIREVIKDEMAAAARGLMRGFTDIGDIIKEEINEVMQEEFDWEVQNVANEVIIEEPIITKQQSFEENELFQNNELDEAIINLLNEGKNPLIGSQFKKHSSRNNGLYQMFMKKHTGIKGAWVDYVNSVLDKIEKN